MINNYCFNWKIEQSRSGHSTLLLNDIRIYSKYKPLEDAEKWVNHEVNPNVEAYLLLGLGLGYHLKCINELFPTKKIVVLYFDDKELEIFKQYNLDNWWKKNNISIVKNLTTINDLSNMQILLPSVWLKALGEEYPLIKILETIKIRQKSYNKYADIMRANFKENITLNDPTFIKDSHNGIAILVAAGPTLDETVRWLKKVEKEIDIYVVGAALKTLLSNEISPKAVVLSDAHDSTLLQFEDINFSGQLFYLSTANHQCILKHSGERYILYQEGYKLSESRANTLNAPLIETGGSVATTTFSLIENLGYHTIVLFGQDLGFSGEYSHAKDSSSIRNVKDDLFSKNILANDGTKIQTNTMFQAFHFWYEEKCKNTKVKVYNTSVKGAKITGVPLLSEKEFYDLVF